MFLFSIAKMRRKSEKKLKKKTNSKDFCSENMEKGNIFLLTIIKDINGRVQTNACLR